MAASLLAGVSAIYVDPDCASAHENERKNHVLERKGPTAHGNQETLKQPWRREQTEGQRQPAGYIAQVESPRRDSKKNSCGQEYRCVIDIGIRIQLGRFHPADQPR